MDALPVHLHHYQGAIDCMTHTMFKGLAPYMRYSNYLAAPRIFK